MGINRNIEIIPTPVEIRPRPFEVNYQFIQPPVECYLI